MTHLAVGTKAAQATLAKYAKKKASLHDDDLGDIEHPVGGSDEAWVPAVPIRQRIKGEGPCITQGDGTAWFDKAGLRAFSSFLAWPH
jgi:hypothetical protein